MPEFYRGGSRSSFAAAWANGAIANTGTAASSSTILTIPPGSQERLKRVQVLVQIAKSGSLQTLRMGYLAFYREDPDTTTQLSGLSISNPQVLRPKVFATNLDHAVYVDLFLEAITLDGGGKLHVMVEATGSGTVTWAAKWYSDRSLH